LYEETTLESFNTNAQASSEFPSIQQILSDLEQRIEELKEEVVTTHNIKATKKKVFGEQELTLKLCEIKYKFLFKKMHQQNENGLYFRKCEKK